MSEPTKQERTLLNIRQEYFQLATQAGDLSYRVACEQEDLDALYVKMKELNQEGASLQAEAVLAQSKKTAAAVEAQPASQPLEETGPVAPETASTEVTSIASA